MKSIVILFILISSCALAQTTPDSAKYHLDEMETVCGHVYAVHVNDKGVSSIFFGDKNNNPFNAAIFAIDIRKFGDLEKQCLDKKVCVTGWIKKSGSKTQVIITEPSQLHVVAE